MALPDLCAESGTPSLERALERILAAARPLADRESLPLRQSADRVLAADIRAPLDLPPFPNAAMDGYALHATDLAAQSAPQVGGTALAGHPCAIPVQPGRCVRIFTGAPLPEGTDAVVPQEAVAREGDAIRLTSSVKVGANIRHRGGELRAGDILLPAGKRLAPADVGLLAAAGLGEVPVWRRLRVGFLSSGDELRPVGQPLGPGEIHDSNRYVLHALLAELGAEPVDLGCVPDDPDALRLALLDAAGRADAVITTGGASVGEADHLVGLIRELGHLEFWKVAIKPGKPFAFGWIGPTLFFGLPGNPVAVMVTFRHLVYPALLKMQGAEPRPPLRLAAACDSRLAKSPGRLEFQRGAYRQTAAGQFAVTALAGQGSDRLSSVSRANCYIVLPLDSAGVAPGEMVVIEPFDAPF